MRCRALFAVAALAISGWLGSGVAQAQSASARPAAPATPSAPRSPAPAPPTLPADEVAPPPAQLSPPPPNPLFAPVPPLPPRASLALGPPPRPRWVKPITIALVVGAVGFAAASIAVVSSGSTSDQQRVDLGAGLGAGFIACGLGGVIVGFVVH